MKHHVAGEAAFFVAVVIAGMPSSEAARERLSVTQNGVTFDIDRFDDGRAKPYRIKFSDGDGNMSFYKFNSDGDLRVVRVDGDEYKVVYTSDGSIKRVTRTSNRRSLAEDKEEGIDADEALGHRRLYACEDCEETWVTVCNAGLESVCNLVDYGSPILNSGAASIETLCKHFGDACSSLDASSACEAQCEEEEGACDPNPCNTGSCSLDAGGGHICSCPAGFGGMSCQIDTTDLDPFYIEIVFSGTWTTAQEKQLREQADRWERIITHVPCGGTNTDPPGRLKIKAVQRTIDGVGGILGEAGPYRAWNDCPGISIEGEMVFDIDDIAELSPLELELLYLHEMGHVIGIGTNWEECSTCEDDRDPEWLCPAAVAVYRDLLMDGSAKTSADIVERNGGAGTRCGHWDEEIFVDELLTGFAEEGEEEPLSKLTVASLEDIGYIVNPKRADAYTLPALRDSFARRVDGPVRVEKPDIAHNTTKYYVDSDGNIVSEKVISLGVRF